MDDTTDGKTNPYKLDPRVFPPDLWKRYTSSQDITVLPRVPLVLASIVSIEEAAKRPLDTFLLFQPARMSVVYPRDIVILDGRKYDGHMSYEFCGKLYVAGRADKTLAEVAFRPGRSPGYEILHSPRWVLADPAAFDELRRQLMIRSKLAQAYFA